jgi:hypothetical protein
LDVEIFEQDNYVPSFREIVIKQRKESSSPTTSTPLSSTPTSEKHSTRPWKKRRRRFWMKCNKLLRISVPL